MVREGKTARGSVLYYQNKNRLLDYLGKRKECIPYCSVFQAEEAEGILMGSDGAFGDLTLEEIQSVLCNCERPQKVIGRIFEKAREAGEEDNQTAIFYLKKEKEKKKKEVEMEIEFPKTDIRQAVPKEENCCYTKLSEKKKPISLKEKLLGNRFIGGR